MTFLLDDLVAKSFLGVGIIKPWPKGVASRRKLNLRLLATPFGQALRALALTCDDLRSLWSRSNLYASQSKFFTVWPPNPSHRKLSGVHQPIISQ